MPYVDGFILAVKKDRLEDYKRVATIARDVWKEYGCLDYVEAVGDDVPYGELTSFPRAVMAAEDEVVIFSWITYVDKASRDEIQAKIMKDERIEKAMTDMPFDGKRMIYGGFNILVSL
jgi:uncharacterized protein YbaA (DUF1428 family)